MTTNIHPEGDFIATIKEHGIDQNNKGTQCVSVRFETTDPETSQVRGIVGYFYLSGKATEYTLQKLVAMGYANPSMRALNGDCLVGNRCRITVGHETYEDKLRARVRFVDHIDAPPRGVKKNDDAAIAATQFDALLAKTQRDAGIQPTTQPQPTASRPTQARDDFPNPEAGDPNDVPF